MKKLFYVIIAVSGLFTASCEKNNDDNGNQFKEETVSLGTNSMNDVYYSLANGVAGTIERTDWDIAFSVPLQTGTILINEGAGVELYCVGDTNYWGFIDDNSIDGKEPRYNDESDWLSGAFNVNASGFPNYGWGTYKHGGSYNVEADSVYVIKLSNGTYKKLMIKVKIGSTSTNIFKWADINGANEQSESLSTIPYYEKKHFIHYSLVNNEVVEAEPDMTSWDLLFTRYVTPIQTGPSTFMNYPVMGVLANPNVTVAKVTGEDPEKITTVPGQFSDAGDVIGYDWKTPGPNVTLIDSISYFIQSADGKTYQLYFTEYGGLAAGNVGIKVKTIE